MKNNMWIWVAVIAVAIVVGGKYFLGGMFDDVPCANVLGTSCNTDAVAANAAAELIYDANACTPTTCSLLSRQSPTTLEWCTRVCKTSTTTVECTEDSYTCEVDFMGPRVKKCVGNAWQIQSTCTQAACAHTSEQMCTSDASAIDYYCSGATSCTSTTPTCSDSDGGGLLETQSKVKGTVTTNTGTYTDYCLTSSILTEYYCSSNTKAEQSYTCPCANGKCEAETPTNYVGCFKDNTCYERLSCLAGETQYATIMECGSHISTAGVHDYMCGHQTFGNNLLQTDTWIYKITGGVPTIACGIGGGTPNCVCTLKTAQLYQTYNDVTLDEARDLCCEEGGGGDGGCTSQCTTNQCASGTAYKVCSDSNSDGCKELGTVVNCPSGQGCSGNGVCSAASICASGEQTCTYGVDSSCNVCGSGWTCSQNSQCRAPGKKPFDYKLIFIALGAVLLITMMGGKKK